MWAWIIVLAAVAGFGWWYTKEKAKRVRTPVAGGHHPEIELPHEFEFELYGNAFSHCSRKVRLVLAELGIPYEHKPIDLIETGSYQTISPAYLAINPAGQVPTLVHYGHPIYESDDILAYAVSVAKEDAPKLTPADPTQKAEMQRWIDFAAIVGENPIEDMKGSAGACVPPLTFPLFATMIQYIPVQRIFTGLLFHHDKRRPVMFLMYKLFGVRRLPLLAPAFNMLVTARNYMGEHLQKLDAQLAQSTGPWILGKSYTLADVSWTALLLRLDETGFLDPYFSTLGL
ncbi:MAG: glutathione S-transferase family protein, partial [Alphaproteobacteria bacterium]